MRFLQGLFVFDQMYWLPLYLFSILLSISVMFIIDAYSGNYAKRVRDRLAVLQPVWIVASLIVILGLLLLNSIIGDFSRPFIYGQF